MFCLFLGQGNRPRQGLHRENEGRRIVDQFREEGNEALRVIDEAIRHYSSNATLVTLLQGINSTFAACEKTALQNLANALNVTLLTNAHSG